MKYIFLIFLILTVLSCEKKSLTEKEIVELIQSEKGFENMEIGPDFSYGNKFIDSIKTFKKIVNAENFKPIYETDFNNDGKTDYLVNLKDKKLKNREDKILKYYDEDSDRCVLLLSDSNNYKFVNIGKRRVYDIFSSKIINYENKNLIKLLSFKRKFEDRNDIIRFDTLMISNNQVTEYVKLHQKYKIEKIVLTQIGGNDLVTTYSIILKKDSVILDSKFYKKFYAKYFTTNFKNFPQFSNDLNEMDFKNLSDQYAVNGNDLPTKKIEIFFDSGKTKTISDFGESGTLGLVNFYEKIDSLMAKQNWQPIISKID